MTSLEQRPSLEDRIRAATRAAASTVPDDSAPPLQLRAQQRRTNWRSAGFRHLWTTPRIWPGGPWMLRLAAPLAATAAVAVVIAASVAVTDRSHSAAPSASGLAGVPHYYLELTSAPWAIATVTPPATTQPVSPAPTGPATTTSPGPDGQATTVVLHTTSVMLHTASLGAALDRAVIRDTVTGATLATFLPPRPFNTFTAAAATADGLTFVLAAQNVAGRSVLPCGPTRLFFARFNPADVHVALTPLPVREFRPTSLVGEIALSPDGTRLAVALYPGQVCSPVKGLAGREEISVYSLPSGAVMTSQFPAWLTSSLSGQRAMSWAADRTLAVAYGGRRGIGSGFFYLLNTNTQSGKRMALTELRRWRGIATKPPAGWELNAGNGLITADGKTLVAPMQRNLQHHGGTGAAFGEFSASTGDLVQVLSPEQVSHLAGLGPDYSVVWSNSSGSVLVVPGPATGGDKAGTQSVAGVQSIPGVQSVYGVLRGHRFTPIPGAPTPPPAWPLSGDTTIVF